MTIQEEESPEERRQHEFEKEVEEIVDYIKNMLEQEQEKMLERKPTASASVINAA